MGRVPAPIATVFTLLTTPERMEEWLPGCGGAVSDTPLANGVHVRARFGARVTEFVVIDFSPPYRFGWTEHGARRGWRVWFRLDAEGMETTITVCEVWAPTSVGARLWGHVLGRRHPKRHVQQILERLPRMVA